MTPSTAPYSSPGAGCHTCRSPVPSRAAADSETDPARVRDADFDVRDLGGVNQVAPALLVGQAQHVGILAQRRIDQLFDFAGRLRTTEDQLARAVRDTDLDLHAGPFRSFPGSRWKSFSSKQASASGDDAGIRPEEEPDNLPARPVTMRAMQWPAEEPGNQAAVGC